MYLSPKEGVVPFLVPSLKYMQKKEAEQGSAVNASLVLVP